MIETKFGKASITSEGYYAIHSVKEGNRSKLLHRLIFEDYYKLTLLPKTQIHHIDKNPLNNNIENLQMMSASEHASLHHKGNQYRLGHTPSEETRKKMSESRRGKPQSLNHSLSISKANTSTGYFRVSTKKDKRYKSGFTYRYSYNKNGKREVIWAVSLDKLKEKVLSKGLLWKKVSEVVEE